MIYETHSQRIHNLSTRVFGHYGLLAASLTLMLLAISCTQITAQPFVGQSEVSRISMQQPFDTDAIHLREAAVRHEMALGLASNQPINYGLLLIVALVLHMPIVVGILVVFVLLVKAAISERQGDPAVLGIPCLPPAFIGHEEQQTPQGARL